MEEIFCSNSEVSTQLVKKRIILDRIFPYQCSQCGNMGSWEEKPLVLRLDHINGDSRNNNIENLRFLCPNCDSQTSTYCGRNKRIHPIDLNPCPDCGGEKSHRSNRCRSCQAKVFAKLHPHAKKISWPSLENLLVMVDELGFSESGRRLGVSDNAIRKHIRSSYEH